MAIRDADTVYAFKLARIVASKVPRGAKLDANAIAVGRFVRAAVRYCRERPETLTSLRVLMHLRAGDCDDMSIAVAALLIRLGYHVRWAVAFGRDGRANHVWVQARTLGRRRPRWIDVDASTFIVPIGRRPPVARWRPFPLEV